MRIKQSFGKVHRWQLRKSLTRDVKKIATERKFQVWVEFFWTNGERFRLWAKKHSCAIAESLKVIYISLFFHYLLPTSALISLQQMALLGFFSHHLMPRCVSNSSQSVELHLWRTLYRLSYSAAANTILLIKPGVMAMTFTGHTRRA